VPLLADPALLVIDLRQPQPFESPFGWGEGQSSAARSLDRPALSARATPEAWGLEALQQSQATRLQFQDTIAEVRDRWIRSNPYLYDALKKALRFIVEPGRRVLEIRSLTGHLLASVDPSEGVGVEIGAKMVTLAQTNYPHLRFVTAAPEELELNEKFDYVVFNHVFDTVDILRAFERAREHCAGRARLVVINYNQLWQPLLEWLSKLGLRAPFVEPNWVVEQDLRVFLGLAGFRVVRTYRFLLFPKRIPVISWFLNDGLGKLPLLRRFCWMELIVARPSP